MTAAQNHSSHRRKIALLIGNDNYSKAHNKLNHSIDNTRRMSDILSKINFNITMCIDTDSKMMIMIKNFSKIINYGDLVLFYFAGHGCEVNGTNYLIPVDDNRIETDLDVEDIGINLQSILERLVERNTSYVTIFILDCGRSYWLKSSNCK